MYQKGFGTTDKGLCARFQEIDFPSCIDVLSLSLSRSLVRSLARSLLFSSGFSNGARDISARIIDFPVLSGLLMLFS